MLRLSKDKFGLINFSFPRSSPSFQFPPGGAGAGLEEHPGGGITPIPGAALHRQKLLLIQVLPLQLYTCSSSQLRNPRLEADFPSATTIQGFSDVFPSLGTWPPWAATGTGLCQPHQTLGHLGMAEFGKGRKKEELSTAGGQERGNLPWEGQYLRWPWCPGHKSTLPGCPRSLQSKAGAERVPKQRH